MEFIPGLTLANVLAERGPLPWPEVVGLGLQICERSETHARARGYYTATSSLSHLILSEDEQLKLIGFGLAISVDETVLTTQGLAVGTPGYMAPEQICGSRELSTATDLYALGVVLWNLLTGGNPISGAERTGRTARRCGAGVHPPDSAASPTDARVQGIPRVLDDLVVQLMDQSPLKRPHDAAAVARVLVGC